jgi:alkanesulfonate monooxygenase SsuD/methylene tetrahydromethanopterin reductase-like flavin-dependent oxidoreductase (luciferase family)
VKLSAFTVVDAPPDGDRRDRLAEVVALADAADAAGLATLWVAEHHFQSSGLCPSPPVLLAACAARTRRLGLGAMVSVLPFHRPIELAEQWAMVDRLSNGRLRLGVGSGYIPREFEGFGVDAAHKRELFDRNLDVLLAALAGEEVRADGAGAAPVRLNVLPVQRPHPPIWIAVQRREAIPFVGRRGASLALVPYATVTSRDELAEEVREFRSSLPEGARAEVAVAVHLYAGDGDGTGRARKAFERYLATRRQTQSAFYEEKARRDPHHASAEALEAGGFALFGKPSDVAAGLDSYRAIGVDEVLGIFDFGGLALAEVEGSIRRLGAAFA